MAKKVTPTEKMSVDLQAKLQSIGITVKTEEAARKLMVDYLVDEHELDGVEDEDTNSLIEMYESFYSEPAVEEEGDEEVESEEEEIIEEGDEEVEGVEDSVEKVEEVEDSDLYTQEELKGYTEKDLKEIVKAWELDMPKPLNKTTLVAAILAAQAEAGEEEEEVVVVVEEKKPTIAKAAKKREAKNVEKFLTSIEKHKEMLEPIAKLFKKFGVKIRMKYLDQGVSVLLQLENSERVIVSLRNCRLWDGKVNGYLDLNALKGDKEVEDAGVNDLGRGFKHFSPNLLFIQGVYVDEIEEVLTKDVVKIMVDKLSLSDEKLGKNRQKLEERAAESKAPVKKVAPVKAATVTTKKKVVVKRKK